MVIAIDAMGGDHGPKVTVPASIHFLKRFPDFHLILVGDASLLQEALQSKHYDHDRLTVLHASQQVLMDEAPATVLRTKKDSSMRVAINLVKEGKANACVSAGNTGALMATARFVLKTLPGIDRPAIISTFPTYQPDKNMRMLDLGANVDSPAATLLQFAVMGSVLASALDHLPHPSVYLLNIGEEEIKGNEQVKQTAALLSDLKLINYKGYIEGDAIYRGEADVIVCDGFVGNVALKASEGVANFIIKLLKESFSRNIFTKCVGLMVMPILRSLKKRIDPARFNGAVLIGLNGIVIKSHGGAKVPAFENAIQAAKRLVEENIADRIKQEVGRVLSQRALGDGSIEGNL
ncbi:MAG: phosphate acyltransferase [Gammaproteobacteria bacterium RIFCSPHIGHO2_12_FULL_42_10]|nr:MAG: phosphate acyltransferase [Gammaproteobacteria bacterium RIFCSPHIGHO2_12_FULL_42_10]